MKGRRSPAARTKRRLNLPFRAGPSPRRRHRAFESTSLTGIVHRFDRPKHRTARSTTQQWREDLQFLARELPKRHANAFHHTPPEVFEAEVANLHQRMDGLNADERSGKSPIATRKAGGSSCPTHISRFAIRSGFTILSTRART
jgi:hypothetical protein